MNTHQIKSIRPLHDHVLVTEMSFDERHTASGIVILGDDGKDSGIRPRWGQVYAVGPDQTHVQVGQWICVAHGRWTRGIRVEIDDQILNVRRVDTNDILLVSDTKPIDDTISSLV